MLGEGENPGGGGKLGIQPCTLATELLFSTGNPIAHYRGQFCVYVEQMVVVSCSLDANAFSLGCTF